GLAHIALGLAQRLTRTLTGGTGQVLLQLVKQLAQSLLTRAQIPRRLLPPVLTLTRPLTVLSLHSALKLALQLLEALIRQPLLLAQRVGEVLHCLTTLTALTLAALGHHH